MLRKFPILPFFTLLQWFSPPTQEVFPLALLFCSHLFLICDCISVIVVFCICNLSLNLLWWALTLWVAILFFESFTVSSPSHRSVPKLIFWEPNLSLRQSFLWITCKPERRSTEKSVYQPFFLMFLKERGKHKEKMQQLDSIFKIKNALLPKIVSSLVHKLWST